MARAKSFLIFVCATSIRITCFITTDQCNSEIPRVPGLIPLSKPLTMASIIRGHLMGGKPHVFNPHCRHRLHPNLFLELKLILVDA
jgi:hypothetical protein